MKILFITNSLGQGGKERRLVELIKGMKEYPEYELQLLMFSEDIDYQEIFHTPVIITRIKDNHSKILHLYKLYKYIKKNSPDIVQTWDSLTSFYIFLLSFVIKINYIAGHVTTAPKKVWKSYGFLVSLFSFLSFSRSKIVLGNSYAGLVSFNAPKKKSKVIHNGYNFLRNQLFNKDEIRLKYGLNNEIVITMIASFNITKDYLTFLSTACQLKEVDGKKINYVCVGKGPLLDAYMSNYKKYPHIVFTGGISHVEEIISVSDLGVLLSNPSKHGEGISNAIMEFMAQGKPVIASIGGGNAEIITDKKDGFIINSRDVLSLTNTIKYYFSLTKKEKDAFSSNSKLKIQSEFELSKMVSEYVNLYSSMK